MDSRYSVGEDIWRDWINDESVLARTSEDRTAVMELCIKAVQEEPASIVLWSLYGEWVWSTYAVANGFSNGDEDTWTAEDMMICKEVFTRDMVLSVWTRAVEATKWRMDESHVVWNRYLELIMHNFPENPSPQMIEEVQMLYLTRLQIPHAAWDATSQSFWPFISKYKSDGWEEIMTTANEIAAPAKKQTNMRVEFEMEVTRSYRAEDKTALYNAYARYLDWEAKHKSKGAFDTELRCALYERALLRFPTLVEWWLDYADYMTSLDASSPVILPLLERATRHCPWSGELWFRRLLRVEIETGSYDEVEGVKHKATNSGLLPTGGIEEILVVYSAWCSYLRRRAFAPTASDDDVDMAEMAISGVLTDIEVEGKKTYGAEFKGDPLWRIEKIYIKFLTQARRIVEAREFWRKLIATLGSSYDFWLKYYDWELLIWSMERNVFKPVNNAADNSPHKASAVLREAMAQRNLDWPEKIHELYANHVYTHDETVLEIQRAHVDLRRSMKYLKIRREREAAAAAAAAEAATQAQMQDPSQVADSIESSGGAVPNKRKREAEGTAHDDAATKRSKLRESESSPQSNSQAPLSELAQLKRDREHNTITVTHLPSTIAEKGLRRFFADCGNILSINIVVDEQNPTATATVEFETHDDVLAAKTRDAKKIDDHEIHIQAGILSTLYVTNYPPSWAEDEIQTLFKDYGTIVSVRLPSLKYNQRRRFCYVQFLTAEEARAALQLHNKVVDGQHRLVVLMSDPHAKKNRHGATAEGREVHIGNIEHTATEQEIREFFEQSGKVESVRMIKAVNGRFTGTAFVIYNTASQDEAQQSLSLNQKPLQSRLLRVTLATDKSSRDAANKKHGTTKVFDTSSGNNAESATSAASPDANGAGNETSDDTAMTKRERTIALLHLPETVNDTRVHGFFSAFGAIRKLTIRRDKGGALVEFANVEDAGKATMSADPSTLGPECYIGEVAELFKTGNKDQGKKPEANTGSASQSKVVRPAIVSRPGQRAGGASARGGRKPGLGVKRANVAAPASGPVENGEDMTKKSNDDFRAMFLAGKGEGQGEKGKEEQ
ncbi:hypothetical protein ANO11243_037890 [Dothideomycetidae sp. 11243]|nr:hypothetical protein ANO11243_037890 [fungal sp. No.11243]